MIYGSGMTGKDIGVMFFIKKYVLGLDTVTSKAIVAKEVGKRITTKSYKPKEVGMVLIELKT